MRKKIKVKFSNEKEIERVEDRISFFKLNDLESPEDILRLKYTSFKERLKETFRLLSVYPYNEIELKTLPFNFEKHAISYGTFIEILKEFLRDYASRYPDILNGNIDIFGVYDTFIYFLLDNNFSEKDIVKILEEENIILLLCDSKGKEKTGPFALLKYSENFLMENSRAILKLVDIMESINESNYDIVYITRKEFEKQFINKLNDELKLLYTIEAL